MDVLRALYGNHLGDPVREPLQGRRLGPTEWDTLGESLRRTPREPPRGHARHRAPVVHPGLFPGRPHGVFQ